METTAERPGLRGSAISASKARLRRATLILGAGLAILPATGGEVALQDMTSLLEGARNEARWQATFIPSPAGSIEAATFAFPDKARAKRAPAGAGLQAAGGVYTMDTGRASFETPDEARVNRREKGGRVLAETPAALPKAFSAGSILERLSLLRPSVDLAAGGFSPASAGPLDTGRAVEVAMAFEPLAVRGDGAPTGGPARVMVASAGAEKAGRRAKRETGPEIASAGSGLAEMAALGYAPVEPAANPAAGVFGRILGGKGAGFVPPIGRGDHAWAATPLPPSAFSAKEQTCLATGVYFEARGESEEGQAAVAQVILNRVRNPTYPKTICGVVYQNKTWRNRCQFSFACDAIKDRILNKRAYARAKEIAEKVTRGEIWIADVGSSTHYHATYVHPRWASAMEEVDKIGRHIFYRTYGGGWR